MSMKRRTHAIGLSMLLAVGLAFSQFGSARDPDKQLGSTWTRCGGPLGGLGYDIRMHPDDPDTMFVTDSYAGVFKSADGGQNWSPSSNGMVPFEGDSGDALKAFCLTIDPVDPSTIWAGMQNYGEIYKSTDGGRTWTAKVNGIGGGNLEGLSFRGITVDPVHPDTVYAAGEISSYRWSGSDLKGRQFDRTRGMVYKTEDGGESWYEIWNGENLARYVWINPNDTQVLYVSTGITDREAANTDTATLDPGGVGILKSVDGGATWEPKNSGLTNLYIGTLFMHPEDPDILLAGAESGAWPDGGGVFLTHDGGDVWVKVLSVGVNSVEFSLSNPLIAYAGGGGTVYMSDDGGESFRPMTPGTSGWGAPGVQSGFPIDFQVHPYDANRLFANSYGGGNFVSVDSAKTWTVASKGYTGALVKDLAVAPDDPARVYAAARSGIFVSYNSGEDWSGRGYPPAPGLEWFTVTVNPLNPFHLLVASNLYNTILESRDGAETWHVTSGVVPDTYVWNCFAFAPSDTATIYAGSGCTNVEAPGRGIHRSPDGGLTWLEANDAASDTANVAELAVQADNPMVVYAACTNMGILKTTNSGMEWTVLNAGMSTRKALSVAIDPLDPDHILAGMDDAGLWEWDAGLAKWVPVAAGLPAESDVMDIAYCPTDPGLVYIADRRSGVYRSEDGGSTWARIIDGLRMKAVNALAFSADGQELYAATEGEGVFRLDEAGPATAVDEPPSANFAVGHLRYHPNPFNPGTIITYQVTAGADVRLSVYDVSGQLVKTLVAEIAVATGRRKVSWDGRRADGSPAASGVYFFRLKVGDHSETAKMVLLK